MTETTIRLSLRELFEIPYRALRVAGASHGEAQDGAEAAQFAQIQDGTGLSSLIECCRDSWTEGPITLARTDLPGALRFDIASSTVLPALRFGSALVDLATGAPSPATVHVRMTELNGCIDDPLLLGARRIGCAVFAAQRSGETMIIRWATATGDLGRARLDGGTSDDRLGLTVKDGWTQLGTRTPSGEILDDPAVVSAARLAARRSEIARAGAEVDRGLWAEVTGLAKGFKQFDKDRKR